MGPEDRLNYGMQRDYDPPVYRPSGLLERRDERTWAALAHLSIFLNLATGFLGPVAAFVMWLAFRERSRLVASNAIRSMWYQIAWGIALFTGWALTGFLTLFLIGFLLWPVMILLTIVPFAHSAYRAYRVYRHHYYPYI
ncbi:MAG: DUF4870 domain-containing protein [Rubrobacteraceae bacterium]|uniref:DUF4870 domain-containing protein n=1 Tax=Rubrobacter naiadicus TaxID=1392641 RepID=UPI0023620C0F|nr:DUF4870 domain-containing protein [Rubrobacter naiadicus]MBX6764341.1 DUF4870 domain-containing protein [Rubrobacteraceae bacterium]MCL6438548.1 DUF4870 domain-containing protein [Rubrobacteraceae bacterium]